MLNVVRLSINLSLSSTLAWIIASMEVKQKQTHANIWGRGVKQKWAFTFGSNISFLDHGKTHDSRKLKYTLYCIHVYCN